MFTPHSSRIELTCLLGFRDISNLPPDSQITNPIGKIILGYDEDNSLNLDFGMSFSTLVSSMWSGSLHTPKRMCYYVKEVGRLYGSRSRFGVLCGYCLTAAPPNPRSNNHADLCPPL